MLYLAIFSRNGNRRMETFYAQTNAIAEETARDIAGDGWSLSYVALVIAN